MGSSEQIDARARTAAPAVAGRAPAPARDERPLRVEVVTDLAGLEALVEPWTALLRRSPHATAHAAPGFVLTWYRHFERPGGVHVVTVWDGDDLVGLAPFARTRLGTGRLAATLLVSAGTEHGDYGEPLLGPEPARTARAIADHLAGLVRRRTVVNVRRLREDGAMLAALEATEGIARAPMGRRATAAVVRFDRWDDPEAALRRLGRKHGVPRRMRRLAEAHGEVVYVPDDPDLDGVLDTMRDMLARRWGPDGGPPIFRGPGREAFTRESLRALAADGMARVATLRAGGRPVAVSTTLEVGDRQVSDNAAFDPDMAPFGPGQAEMHHMLVHAHRAGAVEVDLRAGDFPYKRRWANAEHHTRSVALSAPGRRGELDRRVRRVLMSLRARRLAALAADPQGSFGADRRRWLLAVAALVGVASGAADPAVAEAVAEAVAAGDPALADALAA
ncbi:MAG: GNAT family N-acetyltransferase [Thermoanaerobacterales bacterium]|jgi:CelD/BcsL family acetyltransferase involved in cellulose biosynthesis|nr:GNAT family N-acetyltransferase [Thermoanaerobacterales bacterium]